MISSLLYSHGFAICNNTLELYDRFSEKGEFDQLGFIALGLIMLMLFAVVRLCFKMKAVVVK